MKINNYLFLLLSFFKVNILLNSKQIIEFLAKTADKVKAYMNTA